jgi:cytochrome oxidase Cu insertion factor (SCO1/SenC/PrrC family)
MRAVRLISFISLLAVATLTGSSAAAQGPAPTRVAVDVTRLGPQVGQQVPDFNLRDQAGRMRNLQSIAGPRGTMLVFLRSADW